MIQQQNMQISMDPDIHAAFLRSKHVSTQNGISGHLFKDSAKRRRSKAQILDDKAAELTKRQKLEKLEAEMKEKMTMWDEMEKALE